MMQGADASAERRHRGRMYVTQAGGMTEQEYAKPNSSTSEEQEHLENTQNPAPANVGSSEDSPPTAVERENTSRLACYRCRCLMEFDPGSRFVQCYKCFAINFVLPARGGRRRREGIEVLGLICPCCFTTNLISSRARFVRCNICSTISATPAHAGTASPLSVSSSTSSSSAPPFPHELYLSKSSQP